MPFLIGKPTPQGYACLIANEDGKVNPNGKVVREVDTYQCAHASNATPCQRVIHVPTGTAIADVAHICHQCLKPICQRCAAARCCVPWMKAVEYAEERDFRIREYGLTR